jgi:hypothetical protein
VRPLAVLLILGLAACDGAGAAIPDATAVPTADARPPADAAIAPDAPAAPDATPPDASVFPIAGFGTITGTCGDLTEAILTGVDPYYDAGDLDFGTDRYDDPADRPYLTAGGQYMVTTPNAGGSSLYSEVFAYELLYRCDLADLVGTETEIQYTDPNSKKADMLVTIDGHPIGVSVTRAVTFPFGDPYTLDAATTLITRKLDDIESARQFAVPADHWDKSMVVTLAYDEQHADVFRQAWDMLDAATRRDTIMVTFVTSGDDLFIYTDQ